MFNNSFYPYNYGYRNGLFRNFSSLGKRFNWSSILNNTQKTLNIINQAIPVMYQIKPIYNNAKTVFRVINAVKEPTPVKTTTNNKTQKENSSQEEKKASNNNKKGTENYGNNSPIFFL